MPTDADAAPTEDIHAELLAQLAQGHVMTLACHDEQGAWASPVFYAPEGTDLFFVSSPRSRHIRALAFSARCAAAIHAPTQDWQQITGVQLAGEVMALDEPGAAHARQVYEQRFPFVASAGAPGGPLAPALQHAGWYRLRIDEAALTDNRRGLGQRRAWKRGI